jgi:hypothetical protein
MFLQTVYYNVQQYTQLISRLHFFLLTSITRGRAGDIACSARIDGGTSFLVHDLCDLSINGFFGTVFEDSYNGHDLGHFCFFQQSLKKEKQQS